MITWLADALRAEGLQVSEVSGWKTRTRSGSFNPVGVMFHHTASGASSGPAASLGICTNGRSDLPGPLCNVLIGRNGVAHVIAAGRCNHAGYGGPIGPVPTDSGNMYLIGVEVENSGTGEPWTETVLDACDKVFAACLRKLGQPASRCWGHKEYAPSRKIDPHPIDMSAYRTRLAQYMAGGSSDQEEEDWMAQLSKEGLENFEKNEKRKAGEGDGFSDGYYGKPVGSSLGKDEKPGPFYLRGYAQGKALKAAGG